MGTTLSSLTGTKPTKESEAAKLEALYREKIDALVKLEEEVKNDTAYANEMERQMRKARSAAHTWLWRYLSRQACQCCARCMSCPSVCLK